MLDKDFSYLYQQINGFWLANNASAKNAELCYGEIEVYPFYQLLTKANPKAFETFLDLGAGTGKAVMTAAMLCDFAKASGIECQEGLYQASKTVQTRYELLNKYRCKVSFIQADIFQIPAITADVIFINATCYSPARWAILEEKLNKVKAGTRVILTTKRLKQAFKCLYQSQCLMSWGYAFVFVYEKL